MRRVGAGVVVLALALISTECDHKGVTHSPDDVALANQLEGVWDVTYSLIRTPVLTADPIRPAFITGTMALLPNESITAAYSGLPVVTDYGSYAVDFSKFGFESPQQGEPATVIAGRSDKNSLIMLLSPSQTFIAIRMMGAMKSDSIRGTWTVSFPRAGFGSGLFLMTRRR
jgi:hypothetical protein